MQRSDVVIIGGSAAAIPAAILAQRIVDQVTVIRKEQKVMVPCGIPYIFGTLRAIDKNVMPDAMLGNAELIIDEVKAIDRAAQKISTAGGKVIGYKRLILATGSQPALPPIPGRELNGVFTITKDTTFLAKLNKALEEAKDVVIVGGGFIGVEFADECRKRGGKVTVVEMLPHCLMLNCDNEFCEMSERKLTENGVTLITGDTVASISGNGRVKSVELGSGRSLKADLVIICIGVTPVTDLAKEAGLEIGGLRGIKVDRYQRTSDPDILAIGDCAEKVSFFTGKPSALRLASIATSEARIAVLGLTPEPRENPGAMGVFSTVIGDLAIGVAGLTEKAAKDAGFDVVTSESTSVDRHPGSMPGATPVTCKLVFDRSTARLLGGGLSGNPSVGEMVNLIGALVQAKATAEDVATFQFGTHPALTASPIAYPLVNAAVQALPGL